MPRPRFHKLEPGKRRAILDAAGREFAERGYEGASLNAVLQALAISKGAFYYYFDDKADLFATVMEDLERTFHFDPESATLTRAGFWHELMSLYGGAGQAARDRPWLLRLGKAFWELRPEQRASGRLAGLYEMFEGLLKGFIVRGRELGVIRADIPVELLISLLFAIKRVHGDWVARALDTHTPEEVQQIMLASVDMYKRMMSPPEP